MELTSDNVTNTFLDCLYSDEEIVDVKTEEDAAKIGAVLISGIGVRVGFNPEKLEKNKDNIRSMLSHLPDEFMHDKGGGFSFLNAAEDKSGKQWTGSQRVMDELFMMGQAIKCVRLCLPKNLWSMLPGGVPYYSINLNEFPESKEQEKQ